jgi:isoleucyl-tRNA synthetase
MYCSSNLARDIRFSVDKAEECRRMFFRPLWNVYRFFVTYAAMDGWVPSRKSKSEEVMDRWIVSRLQGTIVIVTKGLEDYDPVGCVQALEGFVGDLSRWYLRGSRRRFWKNEADDDKDAAYATLHTCLQTVCRLMAPFAPFLAEEMYQNIGTLSSGEAGSVHNTDWPRPEPSGPDKTLEEAMQTVMKVAELGRSLRADRGMKLRQPLRKVFVATTREALDGLRPLIKIVERELNVKSTLLAPQIPSGYPFLEEAGLSVGLDLRLDDALRDEGLARDIIRHVQKQRKDAGFRTDDVIETVYTGDPDLNRVIRSHRDHIAQETLSRSLRKGKGSEGSYCACHTIQGKSITLCLSLQDVESDRTTS